MYFGMDMKMHLEPTSKIDRELGGQMVRDRAKELKQQGMHGDKANAKAYDEVWGHTFDKIWKIK
tara:strand:- start:102 stop:293 length:192 start_codon:yes stop_codon:yes gene_type:complete